MSKKNSKNLAKVQDMLDGNFGGHKTIVGNHSVTSTKTRKVGERWTDAEGVEWEQKEGYYSKVTSLPPVGIFHQQCPDCNTNCSLEKRHKSMFNKFGRCYHCQINFEAELKSRPIRWFAWVRLQELSKMEVIDREIEAMIYEQHEAEKNLWDKSVSNALANSELDNTMKINKNLVN